MKHEGSYFAYAMLYITFEGAIRKWTGFNEEMLILRYLLLGLLLLLKAPKLIRLNSSVFMYTIVTMLSLIIWYQGANSLKISYLGLIHSFSFFVFFLVFLGQDTSRILDSSVMKVLSVCWITLGIVQYSLPSDHLINSYNIIEESKAIARLGVSDRVRITGFSTYITSGGFTYFILLFSCMNWMKTNFLNSLLVLGSLTCIIMNGSRYVMLLALVFIFQRYKWKIFLPCLLFYLLNGLEYDFIQYSFSRFESKDTFVRVIDWFSTGELSFFGSGALSTVSAVSRSQSYFRFYEYEFLRLLYEFGVVGLALIIITRIELFLIPSLGILFKSSGVNGSKVVRSALLFYMLVFLFVIGQYFTLEATIMSAFTLAILHQLTNANNSNFKFR